MNPIYLLCDLYRAQGSELMDYLQVNVAMRGPVFQTLRAILNQHRSRGKNVYPVHSRGGMGCCVPPTW